MAKIPYRISLILKEYLNVLLHNSIPIETMILFGSYAKGSFHEWSDIDVAIVSSIFEGERIKDKNKIRRLTLSVSSDLEIFPYNPNDFDNEDPLVHEILSTGVKVF